MTCSRGWKVVEDWMKMSQSAFWFKQGSSCLERRVWRGTYTHCLDVGVGQNGEDWNVSLLEEPWLSMCLNDGR